MLTLAERDAQWMGQALSLARHAAQQNEVPVGALVVQDGVCIGRGSNACIALSDPTAHAEVVALREAARRCANYRLSEATLYVTLEPCLMCVGALLHARIQRLVFGAFDRRGGAVESVWRVLADSRLLHRVEWVGGVVEAPCRVLLQDFFAARRGLC